MRILVIGDPHGDIKRVRSIIRKTKKVDCIILTGDLGNSDALRTLSFGKKEPTKTQWRAGIIKNIKTAEKVVSFLAKQAPVFTIYGNIEYSNKYIRQLEKEYGPLPKHDELLSKIPRVKIFNYKSFNFGGLKFGGIPFFRDITWAQTFMPTNKLLVKASKIETSKVNNALRKFGKLDVLVCHVPPYGILDKVKNRVVPKNWQGKNAGSKVLLQYVKKHKPEFVFCGHIHEGKGKKQLGDTLICNLGHGGYYVIEK